MKTATNSETGERIVLHEGQWKPYDQSATNPEGEKVYLAGGQLIGASQQPSLSAPGALSKGLNVGLTNLLGAPIDLLNAGLGLVGLDTQRPVGGSNWLRGLMPPSFAYENVSDLPQEMRPIARAGEVIGGSVVPAAAPFAVTRELAKVPSAVRPIVAAARQAPKSFIATEAASTAGAAQGAAGAELLFPGNPVAGITGEVAGGFVNPLGAATRAVSKAVSSGKDVMRSFTPSGREQKAAEVLQDAMQAVGEDPARIAQKLREVESLNLPFTAAQKADSPTLLAFETTLSAKNPDFSAAMKAQHKETYDELRKLIGQLETDGDPELLRVAAKTRERYFQELLKARVSVAETQAQRAASLLGGDQAAASIRGSQILDNAIGDARKVEANLWSKVPSDEPLAGSGLIEAHASVRAGMLPEEPLPPSFIEQFVTRVRDSGKVTSGEMQRFRSQMLLKAREARAQNKYGDARIYEDMADGALADLATVPGQASAEARAWSKALHDNFTRTFAGDALATKRSGADRIAPEAVLARGFGSGGAMAAKRFDEMQSAATFAGPRAGIIQEQEEFLRAAAQVAVDPQTGIVNPRALEGFLRSNNLVLERFPALKRDLADAATAEQTLRNITAATKTASRAIQQRTAFSQVLMNESPSDAVRRIVSSDYPQRDYASLAKLARRGPNGSVDGLKAATLDYAAKAATSNTGEFSFSRYQQILNQPMSGQGLSILNTMRAHNVLSTEELARMNAILQNATRIERSAASTARMGELIGEPDALFDLVVRAVGANIGGASALGQAAGAPIVLAGAGSRVARNLFEKLPRTRVLDVMMEAAKKPEFMARLLEKPATPKARADLQRQINAFLIQAGLVDRNEKNQPPTEMPKPSPRNALAPATAIGVKNALIPEDAIYVTPQNALVQ